jgi:hypothetical protein
MTCYGWCRPDAAVVALTGTLEFHLYSIDEVVALVIERPIGNWIGADDHHL